MQKEMPRPEETGTASGETPDHSRVAADQSRTKGGQPENDAQEEHFGSCEPDEDFDYMVTPFPEHISKVLSPNGLYLPWIYLGLAFAVIRVSAMIICGEESGRFALNICYALLPGILAALIIAYSKQTEKTTRVFCGMVDESKRDDVVKAYEKLVRKAFSNWGMLAMGLVFIALFWPGHEERQLYPTPSHNIAHRAAVRDRKMVTVGKTWENPPQSAEAVRETPRKPAKVTTWGWVELPLGKVLRLAEEENKKERLQADKQQQPDEERKRDNYYDITFPPQASYDPLPPKPTLDEDIDEATSRVKRRIDPEWDAHSPELKRMKDYADESRPKEKKEKKLSLGEKLEEQEKARKEKIKLWTQRRAARLPAVLAFFYERMKPAERWALSQNTYEMIMLPLLFMSGAMFWCLIGITWLTWSLGRKLKKGEKNIWQTIEIGIHPCLSRSVRDVGKNLWFVAVITGGMYTVIVVCMFFARADALSLTISSIFSLLVVTIFIVPQLNMHHLMVRSKYNKMRFLNTRLNSALDDLQHSQDAESVDRANAILDLQKALGDCCEWPYDFKSLALVVGSVIIPVLMAIFTLYEHFK